MNIKDAEAIRRTIQMVRDLEEPEYACVHGIVDCPCIEGGKKARKSYLMGVVDCLETMLLEANKFSQDDMARQYLALTHDMTGVPK